jgi:hypothetical protein
MPIKYQKILIGISSLVIIGATILLLNSKSSPTPPSPKESLPALPIRQITVNPTPVKSVFGPLPSISITFQGQKPDTPNHLPIYFGESLNLIDFAHILAPQLNLSPRSDTKDVWVSPDENISLTVQKSTTTLLYSVYNPSILPGGLNQNRAFQTAQEFLSGLGLNSLDIVEQGTVYLPSGSEYTLDPRASVTPQAATYALFPLRQLLGDYPLYIDGQASYSQTVLVNSNYQVDRFVFTPPVQLSPTNEQVDIIPVDQIILSLQQESPVVTMITGSQLSIIKLTDLNRVDLNQAILIYRYNSQTKQALPYYDFAGSATMKDSLSPVIIQLTAPAYK